MIGFRRTALYVLSGVAALALICGPGTGALADSWTEGAPMLNGRAMAAGALLGDEFYVLGGDAITGPRSDTEIFDIKSNFWRPAAALPDARNCS